MYDDSSTPPVRTAHTVDRSWRCLADDELQHYLRQYKRDLALTESADDRDYLAMLVSDAEQEWSRRLRAAEMGVPLDANRFTEQFIDDLKSRSMLDVLFEHEYGVKFGKVNASGWRHGDCPICLHKDCFGVSVGDEHNQRYMCFSCPAKGDAINAIRQLYGDTFHRAIERLAKNGGIPLPPSPPRVRPKQAPKKPSRVMLSDTREGH